MIYINYLHAFIKGIKPAIFSTSHDPILLRNLDDLKEKYPYIDKGIDIFDGSNSFLFFQNDLLKDEFLSKLHEVVPRSPEFHKLLGLTLGYPPQAVQFYVDILKAKINNTKELEKKMDQGRVGLHYCGFGCTSHVNDLVENVNWLWEKYAIASELEVRDDQKMITIGYLDQARLKEVKDHILEKRLLNVTYTN